MGGYAIIWPLFGAANQLLAALALLAVCSFLGNIGRNNKMFYIPMVFMLIVTLTSLALTAQAKVGAIMTSGVALAPVVQLGDQRNRVLAVLRLGTARRLLIALELLLDDVPFFVVLNGGQDANSEPSGTVSVSLL